MIRRIVEAATRVIFSQGFLFSLFLFSSGSLNGEAAERWDLVGKSQTETRWFINADSLSAVDGSDVSFWVRSIPDKSAPRKEESTKEILRTIQSRNFANYDYTEALWQIDCGKGMSRVLYFAAYDKNGAKATELLTPEAPWTAVMPGSAAEAFRDAVCEKSK